MFAPYFNTYRIEKVNFNELHRGTLGDIETGGGLGKQLYSSSYQTIDVLEFIDGTKFFGVTVKLPQGMKSTEEITCGEYSLEGNPLPFTNTQTPLLSSEKIPIGKIVCTTDEFIVKQYKGNIEFFYLFFIIGVWWFFRQKKKTVPPPTFYGNHDKKPEKEESKEQGDKI